MGYSPDKMVLGGTRRMDSERPDAGPTAGVNCYRASMDWDSENTGLFLLCITSRVDSRNNRTGGKRKECVSYRTIVWPAFALTGNNIPLTTPPSQLVRPPMRLVLGSFPPRPLHLRLLHALTRCARSLGEMV
jgi:hypothetical protein